jgi:hypothetical protein
MIVRMEPKSRKVVRVRVKNVRKAVLKVVSCLI